MTGLLEALVSPTSGGTESCKGVTTSALQDWQSIGLKKAITREGEGNAMPVKPQTQLSVVSTESQSTNTWNEEDGILLVVPARIFGHEIRVLIRDAASSKNPPTATER